MSLVPTLRDPTVPARRCVFAEHNWHVFRAHERMVRQGDWVYIRNAWPQLQLLSGEAGPRFPSGAELWAAEEKGSLRPEQRDLFLVPRPAEELYDLTDDPDQLHNLAAVPDHRPTLRTLRALLDRWTDETGDTVPADPTPDREDVYGVKNPDFHRGTMPGSRENATAIRASGPH